VADDRRFMNNWPPSPIDLNAEQRGIERLLDRLASFPQLGELNRGAAPTLHRGFSGALVWSVQAAAGRYAVRLWPSGWLRERLEGLHHLLRSLAESGLTFLAVPLRTSFGTTLTSCDDRWLQVEPWLPGVPDAHPSPVRSAAAMHALARWHIAAAKFRPAPEHRAWFASAADQPAPSVAERLQRLQQLRAARLREWEAIAAARAPAETREWLSQLTERIVRGAEAVLGELNAASRWTVPVQPVLRDIWRDHVLYTGADVTGLIDPSACRTDTVAADLARLLGSLYGNETQAWEAALASYQAHRPLSAAECRLIPVLHRSGILLSGATWLEWLGPRQRFDPDDPRVMARLRELVANWPT